MSTVRQEAIRSIAGAHHKLNRIDFMKTHVKELFGMNVFNEETQRARLPKQAQQHDQNGKSPRNFKHNSRLGQQRVIIANRTLATG